MSFSVKYEVRALLMLSLATLVWTTSVHAQSQTAIAMPAQTDSPDPADPGWHIDVVPYLWFPGINGTVGALGHEAGVSVTARNVLSYFDFGLMGAVEIRYNRIIIPVDFMWVRLKDSRGIPFTDAVESVNVKINEDILTPKVGYRLVDKSRFKAHALFGVRYWHLGTTLTLQPQIGNGFYGAANWVDAVEGARFQWFFTPKAMLTIAGDAGGGGSKLDYQVVGLIGYKLKRVTLQGGCGASNCRTWKSPFSRLIQGFVIQWPSKLPPERLHVRGGAEGCRAKKSASRNLDSSSVGSVPPASGPCRGCGHEHHEHKDEEFQ